jgi:hypothetical protein
MNVVFFMLQIVCSAPPSARRDPQPTQQPASPKARPKPHAASPRAGPGQRTGGTIRDKDRCTRKGWVQTER